MMKGFIIRGKWADVLRFLGALAKFEREVPINLTDILNGEVFRVTE